MLEALAEEPSSAGLPIAPDALWDAGLQGLMASQHFVFGHDCLYPSDCQTLRRCYRFCRSACTHICCFRALSLHRVRMRVRVVSVPIAC